MSRLVKPLPTLLLVFEFEGLIRLINRFLFELFRIIPNDITIHLNALKCRLGNVIVNILPYVNGIELICQP